ncbi:hypothetical protein FIBSPDRAFT_1050850 [Athelia psychrophila]|uniref:Uncharacterized protein n=1 Tax=Athelia psychrophila TaxID=1759441 RepID=A0A166A320_9AGAM|nr:hypothetical protein FIBSPDRAFT_1050850 [Fibularhizoctonia sp. CBS 109695]
MKINPGRGQTQSRSTTKLKHNADATTPAPRGERETGKKYKKEHRKVLSITLSRPTHLLRRLLELVSNSYPPRTTHIHPQRPFAAPAPVNPPPQPPSHRPIEHSVHIQDVRRATPPHPFTPNSIYERMPQILRTLNLRGRPGHDVRALDPIGAGAPLTCAPRQRTTRSPVDAVPPPHRSPTSPHPTPHHPPAVYDLERERNRPLSRFASRIPAEHELRARSDNETSRPSADAYQHSGGTARRFCAPSATTRGQRAFDVRSSPTPNALSFNALLQPHCSPPSPHRT